ncbi:MAG: ribonuclease P protein component [Phycisphaerae bacterium]|nr:ribonuclease P protein component [Phycisphaerae bacterium]MBM90164.1 ribonuclease P protein component [Phycisphaerae bacterium]
MAGTTQHSEHSHDASNRAVFQRRHRLAGGDFSPVFESRLRKSRGPITVHLRPTSLDEHRLGLSIGRRFGGAVQRGRFKRLMREAFRLNRGQLPTPPSGGAYDIVVTTRAHESADLERYAAWFLEAVQAAHRVHAKRVQDQSGRGDG